MADCVTITITHRNWGDPKNAVIGFYSSQLDGNYAEGDRAWGWGGYGTPTDEEYLQSEAIPKTLSYLGGKFKSIYGREMLRTDICGQGALPACVEGTTRTVKCPTSGLMITQKCTGNAWVTIPEDKLKCEAAKVDYSKYLIVAVIIVILYFSFFKDG